MSSSRLENLPTELLWRIGEYVGHSHSPTVLSFAMASKRCHSVAKRLFFRTIKFSADSSVQLVQDGLRCTSILQRNSPFADVRILVIDSRPRIPAKDYSNDVLTSGSPFSGLPLSTAELIDGDRLQGLQSRSLLTAERPERGEDSANQMDDAAWLALAHLVTRLQALSDVLIWIHYEETDGYDGKGKPSYDTEVVSSMVQSLAPNLKEVHMFQHNGSPEDDDGNPLPPPPPWEELSVGNNVTRAPGQLDCLELGQDFSTYSLAPMIFEAAVVDSWAAGTKLSLLRTLKISRAVSHESLKSLMLVGDGFSRLTTLLFTCVVEGHEHMYYDDVKHFLRSLPQLTSLEMIAWHPSISLAAALPPRLEELWLRTQHIPGQGHDEAGPAELADRCSAIHTLAVKIRRLRGNAAEVALYRALGRFARYDNAIDPSFDDFDRCYLSGAMHPYRRGHIRDVLITTAVDEKLARAIFRTVCAAQVRNRSYLFRGIATATATTAPLERMTLQVEGRRAFLQRGHMMPVGHNLFPYLAVLSRRWLLE
ncbi:hypothetical protein BR93DRAFT_970266 [Coniochaeta sp. PMI_546]|nr:hypothetical protein BR93DRAFT_970266 [Coniochaeta sp. PMI_546]